jgi:hypothetical protein
MLTNVNDGLVIYGKWANLVESWYLLFSVTSALAWTNTAAYYGIRSLRILNGFTVQAPEVCTIKLFTVVIMLACASVTSSHVHPC